MNLKRLVLLGVVAVAAVAIVQEIPDLIRYLKIKSM